MVKGIKRSLPEIGYDEMIQRQISDTYIPNENTRYVVILETWETWGGGCTGIAHIGVPVILHTLTEVYDYIGMEQKKVEQEYRDSLSYTDEEIEEYMSVHQNNLVAVYKGKLVGRITIGMYTVHEEHYKFVVYTVEEGV